MTILFDRNDGSIKDYFEDKMLYFSFLMYIKKKMFLLKFQWHSLKLYETKKNYECLSFSKDISKEKYYLEFHFKILFLLQNINDIIEAINNLLGIKNIAIKEL